MLGRKYLPVTALFMLLVLALVAVGVGFGLWSKLLLINGTVHTGKVDAVFYKAFTDDDGTVNNPAKDGGEPGDEGKCFLYGDSSCDPKAFGPNPDRYDKDVGDCFAWIGQDPEILHVNVENGYPSYHCTVWFDIWNNGTIPVKIQSLTVNPSNFTNGTEVTVGLSELTCGQQIDPVTDPSSLQGLAQGDIHIHVEQAAKQSLEEPVEYDFTAELLLVQWNEYFENQCVPLPDGP